MTAAAIDSRTQRAKTARSAHPAKSPRFTRARASHTAFLGR